ncbi:uncharacterized protein [Miscanthus floridulus]|uniref:uncharacterized protein n=1 Tax=Miscanthus floridulus TaxID=154761 RepID=UPI003458506B
MSKFDKTQANVTEMAKKIAKELMAAQVKFFQDEMKKVQDEMSKMKEELSKEVDDAISDKNDKTSGKNKANKDAASDVGADEHAHGKGIYSNMNFNYGQLIKGSPLPTPSINIGKPPHFDGTRYTDCQEKKKKVKDDSSSEEEESDKEVALIIRNFRKFIKKKSNQKTYGDGKRRNKKSFCYGCVQTSHFIADCPNEKKKHKHNKDEDKKNKGKKRGEAHLGEE